MPKRGGGNVTYTSGGVPRHALTGGEYTTIDGVTYSIAPQGPNCPIYRDKMHPTEPAVAVWRRPCPSAA